VRRDQLVWCGISSTRIEPEQPVPLVVYQAPSLSRAVSVQALEKVGRRSRITCTVRGVNGVLAAVRAGLGVTVMARTLMPADLMELPSTVGLPKLPHLDLVLLTNRSAPAEPAKALTSAILASGAPLTTVTG
jgi:DNA-binding transcriptional LysR family regulator